jgi:hypothetical protein
MNTYEQLRERMNELLPDLKRLEFGCEVTGKEHQLRDDWIVIGDEDVEQIHILDRGMRMSFRCYNGIPKLEILGRDPLLSDVLEAVSIYYNGDTRREIKGEANARIVVSWWNLSIPSLKGQSQEFHEFLWEILKK